MASNDNYSSRLEKIHEKFKSASKLIQIINNDTEIQLPSDRNQRGKDSGQFGLTFGSQKTESPRKSDRFGVAMSGGDADQFLKLTQFPKGQNVLDYLKTEIDEDEAEERGIAAKDAATT